MTDTPSHGESGPSHRAVEIGTALVMIAFGAVVITGSLQVGIGWGAEGPKAGFFPFYIAISIIVASILNLVAAAGQDGRRLFADWSQLRAVMSIVIPTAVYVVSIPFTGIYVASIVLIAVFMRWLGRYSIAMCVLVSVVVMVCTFLMFEKWFLVPLPKGPVEEWLGF